MAECVDAALQADLRNVASERYDYELMRLNSNHFSGSTLMSAGQFLHINTSSSAFGSGWGLAVLQKLVVNNDDLVIVIDGDGSKLLFEKNAEGAGYKSPIGDFSTLERLGDGTFRRTMTDQMVYTFNADNLLAGMRDRVGNETTYSYQNWLLTKMIDPVGLETIFAYSGSKIASITDQAGLSTRLTYDVNGNLTKIADPDGTSRTWGYDAGHHMISEIDKRGDREHTFYDFAGRSIRKDGSDFQVFDSYDKLDRLTESIDALNQKTAYSYDALGNLLIAVDALGRKTENKYDARSRIVETIAPDQGSTKFAYDLSNNIISRTNAIDNKTTISYDARNRLVGETDALGKATQYQYDAANNLIAQTDRNGNQTKYTYDDLNRRIQTKDALNRNTGNSYDAANNLISSTDELGRVTKYTYDNRNRQKTVIDPLNGTTTFGYDLVGNLKTITDELNRTTTYNYDALNRRVSVSDPLNQTTRTVYDAVDNITSVADALGQTTKYEYDALDRRVKVTDAKNQITTTAYDAVGNILSVTDPVGNKTSYAFDINNRLISETNALGNTASYQYDFVGNQLTAIDRNGRTRKFVYDKLNRQVGEQWLDASGTSVRDTSYTYDAIGNLLTASDPNSKYTYVYDAVNRLTSNDNKDTAGVPNVLLNYTYDAADNLLKVTDTINGQIKGTNGYVYDALNRATSLTQSGNGVSGKRVDISYDAASQTTGLSRFTGIEGLIAVASTAYNYDANGNRTNTGYSTGVNNQLLSDGTYSYEYDGEGNRTKRTETATGKVTEYIWDYRNRLTNVSFKDAAGNEIKTIQYIYDVDNRRIAKIIDADGAGAAASTTERYVYDGQNIILSFDGGGTQTHRYFYGTGVDQVLADENAQGQVLWTLTDNQGTVRDLIDSAGVIQNHITYDSFGKITGQTNSAISTIFGYTGREYDVETEQYYYRARYYDQNISRFISEDPLGFAAGDSNIYRYVGNSPTNFVDPLGLECECSSTTSNIDYGTVAAEGAKSAAIGLGTVAAVGVAVGAGIVSAPAVAVIGGALLLYSAGSSLFRRSEQARASGNNNLGEIAGATALDTFGFGGLVEGVRGRELVTGRCLDGNERSRGIGQGIGNIATLASGAKVFNTASGFAYKATTTTVYRVEGSGNARVLVDGSGNINIQGDKTLFLNFGQKARAEQFLQKRLDQGFSDTSTKTFDVRNRFVNELRQQAVLESEVRQFPTMPIRVDVTKAPDQFGIRANQFESLNNAIIPGSGRIR